MRLIYVHGYEKMPVCIIPVFFFVISMLIDKILEAFDRTYPTNMERGYRGKNEITR